MSNRFRVAPFGFALVAAAFLTACGSTDTNDQASNQKPDDLNPPPSTGLFGTGLFGSSTPAPQTSPSALGVNAYLWRASLDTVSFMPIASADPFGGVIITDWYSPPESPTERFKVNIFILDRQLHSDGIRAAVFRQNSTTDGRWIDAPVDGKTGENFENAILTRARQLRIASVSPQ
jgi:hypothetical protein